MNKNKRALIIVDMQEFFLQHFTLEIKKELIKNQLKFIEFCKAQNISIILTEYKCRNIFRGEIITQIQRKIRGLVKGKVIKLHNSGFTKTDLDKQLKNLGVREIIIIGINGNACVQDTVIGAIHRGYKVSVSKGLTASAGRKDFEFSKRNLEWFKSNTKFFESQDGLIKYLLKS